MGSEAVELFPNYNNGFSSKVEYMNGHMMIMEEEDDCNWFEEEIDVDLKWSFALNRVVHKGRSEYQEIALLDSKRFGKVLVIDGKMQSAEVDEFIYHECLIHPALLSHPNPKTVFIMGGGEGSAAREALRHTSIHKSSCVISIRKHLTANHEAFRNTKLDLVINDAKAELERREEKFDIIVGDLADPVEGGPCYQLYTKSFYQNILKPKLNTNGIFVTQTFVHTRLMSHRLLIHGDGLLKMDKKIAERIDGELLYLNGASFVASTILNKTVAKILKNESHVYSEDNARFIHGQGVAYRIH
ncbi:UNVERIFIED_CONTAM: Thermospermine synthase ACAULIS5 [Sesamum radiatum]|uniref:thermospermine synthase n=1 Tax=Sesamum radiatum TaxID=300843 RepID=A0AAW2TT94_SESRA